MAHGSHDTSLRLARFLAIGSLILTTSALGTASDAFKDPSLIEPHNTTQDPSSRINSSQQTDVSLTPLTQYSRAYITQFQFDIPDLADTLERVHREVLSFVEAGDVPRAASFLEALDPDDHTPSWQLAAMLTNDALFQIVLGHPDEAATRVNQALETMETAGEIAHPLLVTLLTIQGDLQLITGAYDLATDSYQLARSVDHKLHGVDSLNQVPILQKLSSTKLAEVRAIQNSGKFTGMGQYAVMTEADSFQQQVLRISERNHGKSSEAHTERIMETAHYYMARASGMVLDKQSAAMDLQLYVDNSGCYDRGGDYQDGDTARNQIRDLRGVPEAPRNTPIVTSCIPAHVALRDVIQYQEYQKFLERHKVDLYREASRLFKQSIDIINDIHGPDDIRLVEPYRQLATVMYLRKKRAKGLRYLNRSLDTIVNDRGSDRLDKITALIHAGDFFNMRESPRARNYYLRALAIIDAQVDADELREQFFGEPVVVRQHIRTIRLTNPPKDETPFLKATYRVTRTGEVDKVRFPQGNVRFAARQQVKKYLQWTRYRPRVESGTLVDTNGVVHHAMFKTGSDRLKNTASRVDS
ncbi:MAG: tetratricopeptide repeat protein [Pseudomonadales bacterium]|nr:tetratricopeptide repeat protein [Pseudomonadales bacterium]